MEFLLVCFAMYAVCKTVRAILKPAPPRKWPIAQAAYVSAPQPHVAPSSLPIINIDITIENFHTAPNTLVNIDITVHVSAETDKIR